MTNTRPASPSVLSEDVTPEIIKDAFNNSRMIGELFWDELPENEQQRFARFAAAMRSAAQRGERE
jgi:hypothetical protein